MFPREGRVNRGQSMQDFIFLTSHIQQQRLFVSKGGESELRAIHAGFLYSLLHIFNKQRLFASKGGKSEQRAIHADLHLIYFSFSTSNVSCFQGRKERTEGIPCEPLHYLLLILTNNASCFQGKRERTEGNPRRPSPHLLLILNKQRSPVSKGGKSELTAIHADLHLIYFSFSTSNDLLFAREEKLLREY